MNIATRIRLLGPSLVLATACLVGLVVFWGYRSLVSEQQLQGLGAQVAAESQRLVLAMVEVQHDAHLLARLPAIRRYAAAKAGLSLDNEPLSVAQARVRNIFTSVLADRPDYEQIRLITVKDDGAELVRVQRLHGVPVSTPDAELQTKSHRDYFQDALAVPPDRIHVSEISLNREQGAVEVPHRPMLRAAVPLYLVNGEQFGFVIINMNFDSFVENLFPRENTGFDYYLANSDGDFLLHPDVSRRYGFDLGRRFTIQEEFPDLAGIFTPGATSATAEVPSGASRSGGLFQVRRLYPFIDEPDRFLLLGLGASMSAISTSSARIGLQVLTLTLVLLLVAALAAYFVALRLIQPLSALTAVAEQVAIDQYADFPRSQRDDEVGRLSRALRRMMNSLDQQKRHLKATNVDLEYFARIASHDLREPARRMAMLANLLQFEEKDRVTENGRETLQRIRTEGIKMVEQLTDLRAFSRLGQNALQREETDMGQLIRELLLAHQPAIDERNIKILIEGSMPTVPVYRGLVTLLYNNLIFNALQHVTKDGFLLNFTCRQRDGTVIFGVSNTGSTISSPPDQLFEPFHGAQDSGENSGLGLSICRRIVERHSGKIWVEFDDQHVHFQFTLGGATVDT